MAASRSPRFACFNYAGKKIGGCAPNEIVWAARKPDVAEFSRPISRRACVSTLPHYHRVSFDPLVVTKTMPEPTPLYTMPPQGSLL